jgi:signal transduction histidine kinase
MFKTISLPSFFSFPKPKLRMRVFFLVLLLILIISLLMSVLLSWRVRNMMSEEAKRNGSAMASLFGSTILNYLKFYNFQMIQQYAVLAKQESQFVYLIVYNKEGMIAAHTEEPWLITNQATGLDELAAIRNDSLLFRELEYPASNLVFKSKVFDVFMPVNSRDPLGRWGTVRIGISQDNMKREILKIQIQILEIAAGCLLIGWLGSNLLALKITRPIEQIVQDSKVIAQGDLSHRITIHTGDELEYLSDNYNNMIYQLKVQQDEKIRNERMAAVGFMANTIIHDCRTPITVIKGFSSLIVDFTLPDEKIKECLKMITLEVDRMENMLDELLQFATDKRVPLQIQKSIVDDFIRHCLLEIKALYHGTSISILEDLNCNAMINIDQEKIRRALLNIAVNAKDALKGKGKFQVKTCDAGDYAQIELADDAGGMSEIVRAHIFDPFFTQGKRSGFGLGMAITKKIFDDHQGEISIRSEEGKGTTFILRLPKSKT